MKKRVDLHFNIAEEIKISEHQPTVFWADTELGELYLAITEYWAEHYNLDGSGVVNDSMFYNLGRVLGIREERARRKRKASTEPVNKQINRLAAELISELAKATPEDYLQTKLMMLSVARLPKVKVYLQKVFCLAEEKRPLLLEMK